MSSATARLAVVVLVVWLAGCSLRAAKQQQPPPAPKPAAAAAPAVSGPLSVPQTVVELPPPQPLDPRALATPQEEPAPEPDPAPPPKAPRRPVAVPAAGTAAQQPQPAAAQPETPAQQPAVEERPRLQEIVSPEEKRRITDEINNRKREIADILQQASRRNLTDGDRGIMDRVRSFLQLSDQAATRGDMRQADSLSDRAMVLARDLRNAR